MLTRAVISPKKIIKKNTIQMEEERNEEQSQAEIICKQIFKWLLCSFRLCIYLLFFHSESVCLCCPFLPKALFMSGIYMSSSLPDICPPSIGELAMP